LKTVKIDARCPAIAPFGFFTPLICKKGYPPKMLKLRSKEISNKSLSLT
jgi:hypothetical protein